MKKKILLSVFTVFSLMVASKSFAQYHTDYIKVDAHVGFGGGYGGYHDNDRYRHEYRERLEREIYNGQQQINYTLQLINQKQDELQRDRAFGNWFEARRDKRQLRELYENLNAYQNKLESDKRALYGDGRIGSYRRF